MDQSGIVNTFHNAYIQLTVCPYLNSRQILLICPYGVNSFTILLINIIGTVTLFQISYYHTRPSLEEIPSNPIVMRLCQGMTLFSHGTSQTKTCL